MIWLVFPQIQLKLNFPNTIIHVPGNITRNHIFPGPYAACPHEFLSFRWFKKRKPNGLRGGEVHIKPITTIIKTDPFNGMHNRNAIHRGITIRR